MRIVTLLLAALLLAGCAMRLPAAPPLPAPTPTPDPAALFHANYAAFSDAYTALKTHLDAADSMGDFTDADADWRADLTRLGQEWRATIDAIREQPQPDGAQWAEAWPMIQEAMDDCSYTATAAISAGEQNNPYLLIPTTERMANAMNLLTEAMRMLGRE